MALEIDSGYEGTQFTLTDDDGDQLEVEIVYETEKVSFRTANDEVYVSFEDVDKLLEVISEALDV